MTPQHSQPVVRHNDWRGLPVPALGAWTPTLTVSVLIPAWNPVALPTVLAGLAAQTYPSELLEVVVVDDGNEPPVELPTVRPERTRLVRVTEGWGRANALQTGLEASTGEVVLWLDADMLVFAEHVEAHARWHHVIDHAVVLGTKRFVDPGLDATPDEVRTHVADGRIAQLHDWATAQPHTWLENNWARTDDLATAGFDAFRSFAGATVSMTRTLHRDAGDLEVSLRLGEDTWFAHRLAEAGAVFLPDHAARAWHLGTPQVVDSAAAATRYNRATFTEELPLARGLRNRRGRVHRVPLLEVVLAVETGDDADAVQHCVDAVLDSDLPDVRVVLTGLWGDLTDTRVSPLGDPLRDVGILHRLYRTEPRVELVAPDAEVLIMRCRSPFRLVLADADLVPHPATLRLLVADMERTGAGLKTYVAAGRTVARLERTAAYARADRHQVSDTDARDAFVAETFGAYTHPAEEAGWTVAEERPVRKFSRVSTTAMDPAESWELVREGLAKKSQSAPKRSRV